MLMNVDISKYKFHLKKGILPSKLNYIAPFNMALILCSLPHIFYFIIIFSKGFCLAPAKLL